MKLSAAEEDAAELLLSDVRTTVQSSFLNLPLNVLGSRSTGLATPMSDFDLTFSTAAPSASGLSSDAPEKSSEMFVKEAVTSLKKLQKDIRDSNKFHETQLVMARVPIIEAKHRATGLLVQIQTGAPYKSAQECIKAYLNDMSSLRPLYIVLRHFLNVRGLTTVQAGGLGSYSLFMMIVSALKLSSGTFAPDDLAGQLLYVLYFYGSADLYKFGFSANPPCIFDKLKEEWGMSKQRKRSQNPHLRGIDEIVRHRNSRRPYLLSLQDPVNDINDLGKNAYAMKHIQATFQKARNSVLSSLKRGEEAHKDEFWSCLDPLLRADYGVFEARRSRVERGRDNAMLEDLEFPGAKVETDYLERVKLHYTSTAKA